MRRAFTLIEVAISLLLVSTAVVTIFLLLPSGIRVQTEVRYRALAAAKAMEMVAQLRGSSPGMINDSSDHDKEGVFPWDTRMTYKSFAPDLESYVASLRGTICPLPEPIAYRLDSDDDEIKRLLDAGGQVFYFLPREAASGLEVGDPRDDQNWLSHSRRMLVGIVGAPQQNSILYHPSVKVGPYQDFYPTPPTHGKEKQRLDVTQYSGIYPPVQRGIVYDALARDPAIAAVMLSDATDAYDAKITVADGSGAETTKDLPPRQRFGYWPYAQELGPLTPALTAGDPAAAGKHGDERFEKLKRRAEAYVVAAFAHAIASGLPRSDLLALTPATVEAFADARSSAEDWKQVLAMRYLAHAATCLTRYAPFGFPAAGMPLGGKPQATMRIGGEDFTAVAVTLDHVRAWHETSVRMAVLHADQAGPYHWGASRPLNRQVMMDHPLVQLDLWSAPISAEFPFHAGGDFPPLVSGGRVTRRQWRACYPQPIRQPGLPFMWSGRARDTNGDGLVDPRDPPASAGLFDYPARVLDTDDDGLLDHRDRPVPTAALAFTGAPALGTPDLAGLRTALQAGGQPALAPSAHFTLTAPFVPAERCRQIVFWAADWHAYEDYETAPSAIVDGARYPLAAPMAIRSASDQTPFTAPFVARTDLRRQLNACNHANLVGNNTGNPEMVSCFRLPSRRDEYGKGDFTGKPTAAEVFTVGEIDKFAGNLAENAFFNGQTPAYRWDNPHIARDPGVLGHDLQLWNCMVFLGRYGANRNGVVVNRNGSAADTANWKDESIAPNSYGISSSNGASYRGGFNRVSIISKGLVDTGSIPASVRLRAITVARLNYYDPRVSGAERQ